jgi:hypothetical protein
LDRAPQRRRTRSQRLRAWSPKDVDSTVSCSAGVDAATGMAITGIRYELTLEDTEAFLDVRT